MKAHRAPKVNTIQTATEISVTAKSMDFYNALSTIIRREIEQEFKRYEEWEKSRWKGLYDNPNGFDPHGH